MIDERELIAATRTRGRLVREALRRLAQERLVEVYPRRGMFVTGVDVRELARISEVREMLEPEAARLAAERATGGDREELAALLGELDAGGSELMGLDERIHRVVYRCPRTTISSRRPSSEYYVLALRIWSITLDRAARARGGGRGAPLPASRRSRPRETATARPTRMRAHVQNFEQAMHRVLLTV